MITSLIEMLELLNFGHMTTSTMSFESCNSFVGDVMDRNYDVIAFQNAFTLRRPRVNNLAEIIKIANMFIKKTFHVSQKVKRNRNYALKHNLYLYFLI